MSVEDCVSHSCRYGHSFLFTTSKNRCFSGDRISGLIVIETPRVSCLGQWFSASTVLSKSSENCLTTFILALETQGGIQPQDQDIFMDIYIFRKHVLINFCCLLMWTELLPLMCYLDSQKTLLYFGIFFKPRALWYCKCFFSTLLVCALRSALVKFRSNFSLFCTFRPRHRWKNGWLSLLPRMLPRMCCN